jgi:asparagine synthetase B (glutamine-hydrolysing)
VKKRLFTDRDCGALLSGGVDSSLICGIASMLLH